MTIISRTSKILISDIDNTLLGDAQALKELVNYMQSSDIGFGVATGRSIDSAKQILKEWKVPAPDLWITSVGSEIYYGADPIVDNDWREHINHQWQPKLVRSAISELPKIKLQSPSEQRLHKISYLIDSAKDPAITEIQALLKASLDRGQIQARIIYSHQKFLDILPIRASKGDAVSYFATKWGFSLEQILVAGDSGNDEQMIAGKAKAVVVGNHSPELEHLRGLTNVYFANGHYAQGILEAIAHYKF